MRRRERERKGENGKMSSQGRLEPQVACSRDQEEARGERERSSQQTSLVSVTRTGAEESRTRAAQ